MVMVWNRFSLIFESQTKTFEHEGQNAKKITSALADSCIQFPWPVMSILVTTLCLSLVLMSIFLNVSSSFLSQRCNHVVIKLDWYLENEQMVHRIT